ncbi:SCO family protein [Acidiferrimicrobium sp. IK]|nr:SCO family protein [Acidiferrimicrobium sp. IK]
MAALAVLVVRHDRQAPALLGGIRASGIPPELPTGIANEMGLSPVPATTAPAFTLTDQEGRSLPLSSFRGKVVVLEAMDPHCSDICPLVSREFIDAYRDLGASAPKVVFAALNVNQYVSSVADMEKYSADNGLTTLPDWHFFTGGAPLLRAAWAAYRIQVEAPNPAADVVHTSIIYFIDPSGTERYVASPMVDHRADGTSYLPPGVIADWGRGIAITAGQLAS